jgi:outer membrane lipoprotein carrier protein
MQVISKNIILILIVQVSLFWGTANAKEFLPKSFSAKFEQEYVSTLKGKVKKGNGTIDYLYPGNIRFKTTLPSEILFVSNGTKSWYYRAPFIEGEEGEVSETSAKDGSGIFTKFFDSLKNGLINNSMYTVTNSELDCKVVFTDKSNKEIGVKEAILKFQNPAKEFQNLLSIELTFPDTKHSTIKLKDIKINPNLDAKNFNFVPPLKTKKV